MYLIPLVLWNIGFWARFVEYQHTIPKPTRKGYILLGLPINRSQVDMSGALLQIAAYLASIEASVLSTFIQERVWRAGIVSLLVWPSLLIALWIVKMIIRKYD